VWGERRGADYRSESEGERERERERERRNARRGGSVAKKRKRED